MAAYAQGHQRLRILLLLLSPQSSSIPAPRRGVEWEVPLRFPRRGLMRPIYDYDYYYYPSWSRCAGCAPQLCHYE